MLCGPGAVVLRGSAVGAGDGDGLGHRDRDDRARLGAGGPRVKGSLRQSMAWIHGWLGLIAGWLLFAMFLTGTASYFRPEITRWMQPEQPANHSTPAAAAAAAIRYLQRVGPDDQQWYIFLP
ncbi:hypothetical protein CVH10_17265, partial [Halomonas sp. ND22Bw]